MEKRRPRRRGRSRRKPFPVGVVVGVAGAVAAAVVALLVLQDVTGHEAQGRAPVDLVEQMAVEEARERYANLVRLGKKGDALYQEVLAEERVKARRFFDFVARVERESKALRLERGGSQALYDRAAEGVIEACAPVEMSRPGAFSPQAIRDTLWAKVEADVEAERASKR